MTARQRRLSLRGAAPARRAYDTYDDRSVFERIMDAGGHLCAHCAGSAIEVEGAEVELGLPELRRECSRCDGVGAVR